MEQHGNFSGAMLAPSPVETELGALPPFKGVHHDPITNLTGCLSAMPQGNEVMLVKGGQRALRCVDCGQPDPMLDPHPTRWLNSELRAMK